MTKKEKDLAEITNRQHEEVLGAIQAINEKLNPIYETYQVWLTVGRWGRTFVYMAGGILGLIVAWRQIFKK